MHKLCQRLIHRYRTRSVEQAFRHGQRGHRQIKHKLLVLTEAGVIMLGPGGNSHAEPESICCATPFTAITIAPSSPSTT
jgi:hypothetical protein